MTAGRVEHYRLFYSIPLEERERTLAEVGAQKRKPSMPLSPFARLGVGRLRLGNGSSRGEHLLDAVQPVVDPADVSLEKEIAAEGP